MTVRQIDQKGKQTKDKCHEKIDYFFRWWCRWWFSTTLGMTGGTEFPDEYSIVGKKPFSWNTDLQRKLIHWFHSKSTLTHRIEHGILIDLITIVAVWNELWVTNDKRRWEWMLFDLFTLYFFWPLWQSLRSVDNPRTNWSRSAFLVLRFSRSPVNCCIKHGIFFKCSCNAPFAASSLPSSELFNKINPYLISHIDSKCIYWLYQTERSVLNTHTEGWML